MAARGALPLEPLELATVLLVLANDPDAQVKDTARKSLEEMPDPLLSTVLCGPAHPALLSLMAQIHKSHESRCESIALNPATDDATIAWLATLPHTRVVDIISQNQERMMRHEEIVDALGANPLTGRAVIERILGHFHECLVDGGWLAVGHAESNAEAFRAFRTVNVPGATLYQRTGDPAPPAFSSPPAPAPWQPAANLQTPWSPPVLPAIPDTQAPGLMRQDDARALTGLALVRRLADEGQWNEAARECEQLIEQDRLNPVIHFYQALILEEMRRHADAELLQ